MILVAVFVAIGVLRLPLQMVLLVAIPLEPRDHGLRPTPGETMNSDTNPVATLVWTFGLYALFAVGGANSAIPEMHRITVDVHHWMDDKQFADVFAISQLSPGPECPDRDPDRLFCSGCCGRAGRYSCNVRADRGASLLRQHATGALAPFALAGHHSGSAGSAFDRADGRQWADFGADFRPQLGGRADYGLRGGAGLCHAAIRFGCCWPAALWVLLALSDENR